MRAWSLPRWRPWRPVDSNLRRRASRSAVWLHKARATAKPGDSEARFALASSLKERGQIAEAIKEFREVLRIDPAKVGAHKELGICLEATGQYAAAILELNAYLEKVPGDAEVQLPLGRSYFMSAKP